MKLFLFVAAIFISINLFGAERAVTVSETDSGFQLDNGIVVAQVAKRSGDLLSLKYQGLEMLDNVSQKQPGYWSHNAALGDHTTRITIDPQANGGQRAEVSL